MLDEKDLVEVVNIGHSTVSYSIPELRVKRSFTIGEKKKIPVEELRALSYRSGGKKLLAHHLSVQSVDFLNDIGIDPEPEYFWTEADVKELLLSGSLDRLLDALDNAPEGIIEMIKDFAISLEINDMSKREAIFKATGLNVSKAIELDKLSKEDVPVAEVEKPKRRVAADAMPHVAADKYKVVSK